MPPVQTLLVIVASFLVAGALLPLSQPLRLACAAGAGAIIVGLCVTRLRAHAAGASVDRPSPTQARIDRIRAERTRRMGPRR